VLVCVCALVRVRTHNIKRLIDGSVYVYRYIRINEYIHFYICVHKYIHINIHIYT